MKRRPFLLLTALGVMAAVAALAAQRPKGGKLLLLEWAAKSSLETPPTAVLIELGLHDEAPTSWNGRATLTGAKVVRREGYRFRAGDRLTDPDGWEASSHRPIALPPRNPVLARIEGLVSVGVVLHLADVQDDAELTVETRGAETGKEKLRLKEVLAGRPVTVFGGAAVVRLVSTAQPVAAGPTEDDFPAACYGPDGTLWVAYVSYHVKDDSRRIAQEPLREQPKDFRALYTPEFRDQLFVKYHRNGKWSEPIAVTGPDEDLVRCAIAVEGGGGVWVVYSAHRGDRHDIYARALTPLGPGRTAPRLEREQRWTRAPVASQLGPVACTLQDGTVRVSWQQWDAKGVAGIASIRCPADKSPKNTDVSFGRMVYLGEGNCWHPSPAAGPSGEVAVAYDSYGEGDYDIGAALTTKDESSNLGVVGSSRFEARPSACYDAKGRLWIAYEEGPELWGKEFGALVPDKGEPLYSSRSVRVVCLQDGKLFRPVADLPTSDVKKPGDVGAQPDYEHGGRYSSPRLGLDGKGRLWLTYRRKFGTRYSTYVGSYWLTFARRLDGDRWSEPIEVHHSDGLLDSRPVLLPHKGGGLLIVHNTDGRYTTPRKINNDVYLSYLDLPGDPVEPKLVPAEPGKKDPKSAERHKAEQAAVKRMRDYRVEAGGKAYRLLRGEFHRHTDVSWDGGPDGSLEDLFRYALDAAALDWVGDGDHDNGGGREYAWWLVQKYTDACHVPGAFTPLFSYERSVDYPMGHRNCLFARRGVRTLPRLAEPDPEKRVAGVHADDTKMLYRYLKELDGVCAVHTSATGMGTDWRDNDPQVEPVVEIYQGDRMSYERQDAPRAGHDAKSGQRPVNIGGWFPKGFIDNALDKGYRLGFESSSDHWSTHISYFVVLAERHDRQAILDAVKKRHCYGATHDIVLDVRSGPHVMGDEFQTRAAPALDLTVIGTGPLARIDLFRDGELVESLKPNKAEYRGTWTDPRPAAGVHYYYVRVEQADGELAWASPLWIDFVKRGG
jgi:hypothetical protein